MAPIVTSLASIVKQFGIGALVSAGSPSGLTATGGVISDYTHPDGTTYRAHIFTSSGTFDVTALGDFGDTVEYLLVAGGGSGTSYRSGGGGAGGLRTSMPGVQDAAANPLTATAYTISTGDYTITVGGGGAAPGPGNYTGNDGSHTEFYPTPVGPAHPTGLISHGGGGAKGAATGNSRDGGSGGGADWGNYSNAGAGNTPPFTPPQGNPGGSNPVGSSPSMQGGGGGAGQAGYDGGPDSLTPATKGRGGDGVEVLIAGPAVSVGAPGPSTPFGWFSGGGGAGRDSDAAGAPGGYGGGGTGGTPTPASNRSGASNSGGGGGGASGDNAGDASGSGGSGIVVVRYQIGSVATAKATGGAISFYGGKTIHTFTSSGTFTAPGTFSETCEYVVLGGGASGGACAASNGGGGGGGGAGSYRTGTTPISGPSSTSIQVGAGGASPNIPGNAHGTVGTPSYFGTPITAPTGGYGAMADASPKTGGGPGGSGGGGGGGGSTGTNANAGPSTGDSFPGTIGSSPTAGWGHDGGAGVTAGQGYSGGGGGGAGGGGVTGTSGTNSKGGNGGLGIQLPSSFRNPSSTVGHPGPTSPSVTGADTSGKYYVAGGGGGGVNPNGGGSPDKGYGGVGPGTTTDPFAGAGNAGKNAPGSDATENSGSGGGGTGGDSAGYSGNGGSGIVLIAYPS